MSNIVQLIDLFESLQNGMYLLTEWEGRPGKHLARGQDLRTSLRSVRTF